MSVAYERPPEWEIPVAPTGRRSGRSGSGGTVVAFPVRPTPPVHPEPAESTAVVPADRSSQGPADIPAPVVRPERARPAVRRGPRPCPASTPRPVPEPGLRLTARGRRLVRLLGTACVLGMLAIAAWLLTAHLTAPVVPDSAPPAVVVHSGDSLWTIAHDIAPDSDPRQVVAALQKRNHLDSPVVHVGQTLQIPK